MTQIVLQHFFTQNGSVSIESFSSVMAYLIIVSFIDIKLTLIIGLFYLIAYISVIISNKKTFILMHKIRELNIDITKWANEQIDGIEVIKSLGVEKTTFDKDEKFAKSVYTRIFWCR